jgi:predicted small lipoprotein YifL
MKDILKTICLILLLSVPLAACGIKPNSVDAPQGVDQDAFPRTYPAK